MKRKNNHKIIYYQKYPQDEVYKFKKSIKEVL